jgi:hypothetical protein
MIHTTPALSTSTGVCQMSTESEPKRGRERRAHAAPNARDIAGWARLGITVAGGLLAVASVVVSSISLGRLAADAGYHDLRAVLFALGFDFAAAVTGLAWAGGRPGSYWFHFGRRATLGLFVASCVFQAAEVFQTKTDPATGLPLLPPGLLLAVALCVGFLFPVLSVLFGHLVMTVRGAAAADRAREAAEQRAAAEQAAAAVIAEQAAAERKAAALAARVEQAATLARAIALVALIPSPAPAVVAAPAGDDVPAGPSAVPVRSLSAGPGASSHAPGPAGDPPVRPVGGSVAAQRRLVTRTRRLIEKARAAGEADPGQRAVAAELDVSRPNAARLIELAKEHIAAAAADLAEQARAGTNGHAYLTAGEGGLR